MRIALVVVAGALSAVASMASVVLARFGESRHWFEEGNDRGTVTVSYRPGGCAYAVRSSGLSARTLAAHGDDIGQRPVPGELHLTVAGEASSSVVVQWSTDAKTLASEVRFGDAPDALVRVAHGYSFEYEGASDHAREHQVHLCGLEPNKTYFYDAGGASARTGIHSFTTAPAAASAVVVLVLGEACSDPEIAARIVPVALAEKPTVMLLGGHWSAKPEAGSFGRLVRAAPDLFARLPSSWTYGDGRELGEEWFARLAFPDRGEEPRREPWFSTTYGPLSFIVVDDGVSAKSPSSAAQRAFVARTLGAIDRTRTPWAVAVHHVPVSVPELESRVLGVAPASHEIDLDLSMHARPGDEYAFAIVTATASEFSFDARRADGSRIGKFTVTR